MSSDHDRELLEQELATRMQDLAPAPAPDALERASVRIVATPQRRAAVARVAGVMGLFGWGRAGATLAVAAAALVVGVLIGQAGIPIGVDGSPSPMPSALEASATPEGGIHWEEPPAYSFVFADNRCGGGERTYWGKFRVFVDDGVTLEYVALDETAERFDGHPSEVPTLATLLEIVEEARNTTEPILAGGRELPIVRLVADPEDGHPVEIHIDWAPEAIDDEECYVISEYAPAVPPGSSNPTPDPTPQGSPSELFATWERIDLPDPAPDLFGGAAPRSVVRFGDGYVAVGTVFTASASNPSRNRGVVWTSHDGRTWRVHDGLHALEGATLSRVISDGVRLLVIGTRPSSDQDGTSAPAAWVSTDGLTWQRSGEPAPELAVAMGNGFAGAALEADGSVLFLRSENGLDWSAGDVRPQATAITAMVPDGTGGALLAVDESGARVWHTADGITWTGTTVAERGSITSLAAWRGGYVAAGWINGQRDDGTVGDDGALWTSRDGFSWELQEVGLGPYSPTGVHALPDAVVVIARGRASQQVAAWVSEDGVSWAPVAHPAAFDGPDLVIQGAVEAPYGLLAVGSRWNSDFDHVIPTAWLALRDS